MIMNPKTDPASLSVCMIVKNEAHQIEGALENFRRFADEIVVVDTGSSDETKEIALRYTDRVFEFPWCDDFSAARNHSISHATGDYILWMDADDRVDPEMAERIVQLKPALDGRNAFYFVLEDLGVSGPSCSLFQLRCVPRRDDVRFIGRIHEQLTIKGLFPLTADIVIRHHGYLHKEIHLGKLERNLDILIKEREDGRDDTTIHYYLSLTSDGLGRHEEAIEHMQDALQRIQAQTRQSPGPYSRQMNLSAMRDVHFHLARLHRKANRDRDALRHLTVAQALAGDDARSLFNLGLLFQECREPRKAIRCLERATECKPVRSLFPSAPLPSLDKMLTHIAFAHLRLKEHGAAMARLQEAQDLVSRPGEVWEYLGFLALSAREWSIGLQAYESALHSGEMSATGYYFLGSLYHQRRLLGKAMAAYQKALEKEPNHVGTKLALGRILSEVGGSEQAQGYLDDLPHNGMNKAEIFAAVKPNSAGRIDRDEFRAPQDIMVRMATGAPRA